MSRILSTLWKNLSFDYCRRYTNYHWITVFWTVSVSRRCFFIKPQLQTNDLDLGTSFQFGRIQRNIFRREYSSNFFTVILSLTHLTWFFSIQFDNNAENKRSVNKRILSQTLPFVSLSFSFLRISEVKQKQPIAENGARYPKYVRCTWLVPAGFCIGQHQ